MLRSENHQRMHVNGCECLLCFSNAWMMSLSSCRAVSTLSPAARLAGVRGFFTHIADCRVLVHPRLQVFEDGGIDHSTRGSRHDAQCLELLRSWRCLADESHLRSEVFVVANAASPKCHYPFSMTPKQSLLRFKTTTVGVRRSQLQRLL